MRTLLLCCFVLTHLVSFTQDIDFPDYRSKKENFVRVREADIRNDLASFTTAGLDESIGKSPLKTIPMTAFGANYTIFEGNNMKVSISTTAFDPAKHKMNYYEKHLVKIDNKPYYGKYGEVPKTVVSSVTVLFNKDTITVPSIAFSDIYDPSFAYSDASGVQRSQNRVYLSADNRTIYIYMLNRNSGNTEVTWVIQDKKYLRRVLDFGLLK